MKDKASFRFFAYGLLSGVLISGIVFLAINSFRVKQDDLIDFAHLSIETPTQVAIEPSSDTSKINLNSASIDDLVSLPGIGEAKANAIINFRTKYGNFEEISELTYIPGIGSNLLLSIQDLVIIN